MKNQHIITKLISIKSQVSELGIEFLGIEKSIRLDDVGTVLKPFIDIDASINNAIKKLRSDVPTGSIPKTNTLKS